MRVVSCMDLAEASGVRWSRGFRLISAHLGAIAEWSTVKYGLLFDSIVVNKPNVATGEYEPSMLKGFTGWAKELGYSFGDAETFLREQLAWVFAWAQAQAQAAA